MPTATPALTSGARLAAPARDQAAYRPWIHRTAVLTLATTFLLIALGGIVTSLDVGMAVPDWPTTFGHSMFGYPLSEMVQDMGVFYEHSHRLVASLVGMLCIALALLCLFSRGVPASWRWLSMAALLLVTAQGVVGGLRVLQNDRAIAVVHALGAQAVLVSLVCLTLRTSRGWLERPGPALGGSARRLSSLSLAAIGLLFLQLFAGAGLRHQQTGIQAHLWLALTVTLAVLALAFALITDGGGGAAVRHGKRLLSLLGLQLALGVGTWALKHGPAAGSSLVELNATLATLHLFVGAAILAVTTQVALEARRARQPEAIA